MTTLVPLKIAVMSALHKAKCEANHAHEKMIKIRHELDELEGIKPKFEVGDYYMENGQSPKTTITIKKVTKCFIVFDYDNLTTYTNVKLKKMNTNYLDNEEYVNLCSMGKRIYARGLIKV